MTVIRLLIVDDHPIVRDGLRGVFDGEEGFEVAGEAADGAQALVRAAELAPDVVLMDLRMPVMGGVEAIRRLRAGQPAVRVLVLTTYDTESDVLPAIEAGATGYLLKDAPRGDLISAVRAAAEGRPVLAPTAAQHLMTRVQAPPAAAAPAGEGLTDRELEVLRLVASGTTNRETAHTVHQRGHGQDASPARLRQARRP